MGSGLVPLLTTARFCKTSEPGTAKAQTNSGPFSEGRRCCESDMVEANRRLWKGAERAKLRESTLWTTSSLRLTEEERREVQARIGGVK